MYNYTIKLIIIIIIIMSYNTKKKKSVLNLVTVGLFLRQVSLYSTGWP